MANTDNGTFPDIARFELGFRLSYEDLAEIMELLFNKFIGGGSTKDHAQVAEMRRRAHSAAFNNILTLAGWSQDEFENQTMDNLAASEFEKSVAAANLAIANETPLTSEKPNGNQLDGE